MYTSRLQCYTGATEKRKNTQKKTQMKKIKKKSLGLDREHKDITCAVRVPQTMYEQLCEVAKSENSSISDVIRSSLTQKINEFTERDLERQIKAAKLKVELQKLKTS